MVLSAFFATIYYTTSTRLPYYFASDMDLITLQDLLVLRSGYMPDHQIHPGQGMLVILNPLLSLGHLVGGLAATNLSELGASLVPIVSLAELMDFIRVVTPFLIFGVVLLLYFSIVSLYELAGWSSVLVFTFFASMIFTVQNSVFSRTEQFAVFYWIAGILTGIWAVKAGHRKSYLSLLFLAGFFFGMSFYTKVQALGLISAGVIFILLLIFSEFEKGKTIFFVDVQEKFYRRLTSINLLIFLLLSVFSYFLRTGETVRHLRDQFGITPWWLTVFLFLALVQWGRHRIQKWGRELHLAAVAVTLVISGLLSSLLTHFFIHQNKLQGLRHALLTFKISMLGFVGKAQMSDVNNSRYFANYLNHSLLFAFFLISGFGLLALMRKNKKPIVQQVMLASLIAMLILNIVFLTRSLTGHDLIWVEVSIGFFFLYFSLQAHELFRNSLALKIGSIPICGIMAVLVFFIVKNGMNIAMIYKAPTSGYYKELTYFVNVYGGNQLYVRHVMDEKLKPQVDRVALSQIVRNYKSHLQNWDDQVMNYKNMANHMSYLLPGLNLIHKKPGCHFSKSQGIPLHSPTLDISETKDQSIDLLNRFSKLFSFNPGLASRYPKGRAISLYTRQDRNLYLFFEKEKYVDNLKSQGFSLGHQKAPVVVMNCSDQIKSSPLKSADQEYIGYQLYDLEIDKSREFQITQIQAENIKGDYFLAQTPFPRSD